MQVGIKETKELLNWGFDLQEGIAASLSDGQISFADAPNFWPALMNSATAFGGAQKIAGEIANITESDRTELLELARERFDIPDDELEQLIEDTLDSVLSLIKLGVAWARRTKKLQEKA